MSAPSETALRVYIIAGEHSGDALGAKLMMALAARTLRDGSCVDFAGVGGPLMTAAGLHSLYPMDAVAVMGPIAIAKALPRIIPLVYKTVDAALAFKPDILIIVDSPEFTHPIAKRVRKRNAHIPIVNYVSPSVWAWRSGRARKMAPYVDHVLALLPFEPDAHARLGGPQCSFVGHPLSERVDWLRDLDASVLATRLGLARDRPTLVVLPGSRTSEITRLGAVFGETIAKLMAQGITPNVLVPTVAPQEERVRSLVQSWALGPDTTAHVFTDTDDKFRAFKLADAALAASGTVTLELAMAGTPMVVAYKVDPLAANVRHFLKIPSVVLANLVLGEEPFPEFLQEKCTAAKMAAALSALFSDTPARTQQLAALARIPAVMAKDDMAPSEAAAEIVVGMARHRT